ncbi:MAG: hypothetical protein RJA99_767 [Pseudomonadota bacterium]|jgi:uncharacterized protein
MPVPPIDTHEFTRRGDVAEGRVPVAGCDRLVSLLASDEGGLDWRLSGRSEMGTDGSRRAFLRLDLSGALVARCVRCLEPVGIALAVERDYRLVATEAQAEAEDADEDEVDLLVASRRFDLGGLIEDEAIMALPPAPRHDDCRAPAVADAPVEGIAATPAESAPERRNPFAALAALRAPEAARESGGEGAATGEAGPDPSEAPGTGGIGRRPRR